MADGKIVIDVLVADKEIRTARNEIDNLGESAEKSGSSFKDMFKVTALANLAAKAMQVVTGYVSGLVNEAMDASDAMDKFKSTMEFAGVSDEGIEKSSKTVKKYADDTVYDLKTIANTTAQLAANGVKDFDGLTQAAGNLNAVAGGNSDTFKSVAMMLTQTVGAGKLTTENWNQLADAIPGASGKMQEALKKAGAYTGDFREAMAKGQISAQEFQDAMMDLGMTDAAIEAAASVTTFEGAFGALEANVITGIQNVIDSIGKDNMTDIINQVANAATTAFEIIVKGIQWVSQNMGLVKTITAIILSLIVAFQSARALSSISSIFSGIKVAMSALGGPITIVIAAIAALVSAFIYFYKTSETFRGKVDDVVSGLKKFVSNTDNFGKISDAFSNLGKVVSNVFGTLGKILGGDDVSGGIGKITDSFSGLAKSISKNAPKIGTSAGNAIKGILTAIAKAVPGIVSGSLQIIAAFITGIAQGLPQIAIAASKLIFALTGTLLLLIPQVVLAITTLVVALLAALTASLPEIIAAGSQLLVALLQGITEQIPSLVLAAGNLVVTFITSLTEQLPNIIAAGMNLLTAFINGIAQNLPSLVESVSTLIITFLNSLALQMPQIVTAGANLIVQFLVGLTSNLDNIIQAGVDIIIAVINGIASSIDRIVEAGMNLVDSMVEGILRAQDRLFKAAITLVNGMADNIRNNRSEMREAASNLLSAMIEGLPGNGLYSAGSAIMEGFLNGLKSAYENVKKFVGGIATWIEENKGPIAYDRKLLIPAGKAIMGGFNDSLQDSFKQVQNNVSTMASRLSANFNITPEMALGTGNIGATSAANQIVNNYSQSSNASGIAELVSQIANRPVQASFQIGEREIVKAIAKPLQKEFKEMQDLASIMSGRRPSINLR